MRIWKDVPFGYCHCGCGRKTTICKRTQHKMGHVAGQPFHYIGGHATKEDGLSRFNRNYQKSDGDKCWLWTGGLDAHGYGSMSGSIKAHRFAYELAYGPFDKKLAVLHRCDCPACVRPDHLFLGTQADNVRDMWAKGRAKTPNLRGEDSSNAVLKESDVRRIKKLFAKGVTQKEVVAMYAHKITKSGIAMIKQGRTWKHVKV